jgi:kinetochore protein Nuf2
MKADEQAEAVARMDAEAKDFEARISELNVQQAEIREVSSSMKSRNNELKDSLASKQLRLEELLAQKRVLQGQIVSSPEKLKKQLDVTSSSLQTQHAEIKACERKLKELGAWNECVGNAIYDVQLAKESIDGLATELAKNKQASAAITTKEQTLGTHREVLKTLQQNSLQMSRKVARHEEKNAHLKQQAEARAQDATLAMDKLQTDIIAATNVKSDVRAKGEALDNEVLTMKKLVESERTVQEQEIGDIKESYQRMETVVVNHLRNLREAVNAGNGQALASISSELENLPLPPAVTNYV